MSDIEDHYDGEPHTMIDKYRIVRKLGTGTFGRVFLCNMVSDRPVLPSKSANKMSVKQGKKMGKRFDMDRARRDEEALQEAEAAVQSTQVAVKVIRPVEKYVEDAMEEVDVLRKLQGSKIAAFVEAKPWRDRYIIVTKSYGRSLWDVLRKRDYKPIREELVFRYIEQLLQTCDFMHSKGYVHTDIKPENILVEDMNNINQGIRVIDLGGVKHVDSFGDSIIQTRQYRAPEVILRNQWSFGADIWSVGCVMAELLTGDVLFPAHDNRTHLAMIERTCGKFPEYMSCADVNFDAGTVKFPCMGQSADTVDMVSHQESLLDMFRDKMNAYGLLRHMLAIDPLKRPSARELLDKIDRWRQRGKI